MVKKFIFQFEKLILLKENLISGFPYGSTLLNIVDKYAWKSSFLKNLVD